MLKVNLLKTQNKSRNNGSNSQSNREKMFFFDCVASFQPAVKNCEGGKRGGSDYCGDGGTEKRADHENENSARRAGHDSPENSEKRHC